MPSRPGCGAGSTVGSATGTPPLINDPSLGTGQATTQNQLKANPMPSPITGGVGSGC
jgi:hypothetical protein